MGISKGVDILDHIYSLATEKQPGAMESVREVEREAMLKMVPQKGLIPLMEYLEKRGVRKAICTRNFQYALVKQKTKGLDALLADSDGVP